MIDLLPVTDDDLAPFVALNNLAVPNVNTLDEVALTALLGQSWWCRQAFDEKGLQGFLLALRPGEAYASDNYRWFSAQYDEFAYVDRIVVDEACRSQGLGALLYRALEDDARAAGLPRICCEVNLDPPNPRSLAFHRRLGFETVGEQETKAGSVKVSLLVKELL
jgi:predicted GNAT superfamily acetyltransferase